MSMEFDNRNMVLKINEWFKLVSTFQIIFIISSFIFFFPIAIVGFVLLIVMSGKTQLAVKVAIAGHVLITVMSIVLFIVYKSTQTATDAEYVSTYGVFFKLIYAAGFITFIINLSICALCIRAHSYAKENDFLKKLDGYPYFFERRYDNQAKGGKNISQTKTVNLEIKSFENSDFCRYFINGIKQTINNLFNRKIKDVIGYAKLMTVFIIFINFGASMIFLNEMAGANAFNELVFLLIVLVKPAKKKVVIGFGMHIFFLIILTYNTIIGEFSAILLIMNIIQIFIDLSVYKNCSRIGATQKQTLKDNLIKNNGDNDNEYVYFNGVYKKKLHVELKKKSDLSKDNEKKA